MPIVHLGAKRIHYFCKAYVFLIYPCFFTASIEHAIPQAAKLFFSLDGCINKELNKTGWSSKCNRNRDGSDNSDKKGQNDLLLKLCRHLPVLRKLFFFWITLPVGQFSIVDHCLLTQGQFLCDTGTYKIYA